MGTGVGRWGHPQAADHEEGKGVAPYQIMGIHLKAQNCVGKKPLCLHTEVKVLRQNIFDQPF